MCTGGDNGAEEARRREEQRQARIREGLGKIDATFAPFDDQFYEGRGAAYTNFALPQLDDQFTDAKKKLIFALSRNGRLQSSVRGDRMAELQKQYDLQRQTITDRSLDFANQARSSVEAARADLVAQNNALADPAQAAALASNQAAILSQQPSYEPLGILFQNVTEGLASQADLERRTGGGGRGGFFPTSGAGSARVAG